MRRVLLVQFNFQHKRIFLTKKSKRERLSTYTTLSVFLPKLVCSGIFGKLRAKVEENAVYPHSRRMEEAEAEKATRKKFWKKKQSQVESRISGVMFEVADCTETH